MDGAAFCLRFNDNEWTTWRTPRRIHRRPRAYPFPWPLACPRCPSSWIVRPGVNSSPFASVCPVPPSVPPPRPRWRWVRERSRRTRTSGLVKQDGSASVECSSRRRSPHNSLAPFLPSFRPSFLLLSDPRILHRDKRGPRLSPRFPRPRSPLKTAARRGSSRATAMNG